MMNHHTNTVQRHDAPPELVKLVRARLVNNVSPRAAAMMATTGQLAAATRPEAIQLQAALRRVGDDLVDDLRAEVPGSPGHDVVSLLIDAAADCSAWVLKFLGDDAEG